jgi:hypothetical protein
MHYHKTNRTFECEPILTDHKCSDFAKMVAYNFYDSRFISIKCAPSKPARTSSS